MIIVPPLTVSLPVGQLWWRLRSKQGKSGIICTLHQLVGSGPTISLTISRLRESMVVPVVFIMKVHVRSVGNRHSGSHFGQNTLSVQNKIVTKGKQAPLTPSQTQMRKKPCVECRVNLLQQDGSACPCRVAASWISSEQEPHPPPAC